MPVLPRMICDLPTVTMTRDLVQVDVTAHEVLVERVVMTPHTALLLAERLRANAIALLNSNAGAEVVDFKAAEGH